jgi:hypothetical protein
MTKISILYPNIKGARFDIRYYVDTHMPLSIQLLSTHPGFKGVSVRPENRVPDELYRKLAGFFNVEQIAALTAFASLMVATVPD